MKYYLSILYLFFSCTINTTCVNYDIYKYVNNDSLYSLNIYKDKDFKIIYYYLFQDEYTYNLEYGKYRKIIVSGFEFNGKKEKKTFKLIDMLIEVKTINGKIITYNEICWHEHNKNKDDKHENFGDFASMITNNITFSNSGVDNIVSSDMRNLGYIYCIYNIEKVPDKVIVLYRIKFIYNDIEYFKEDSIEVIKKVSED